MSGLLSVLLLAGCGSFSGSVAASSGPAQPTESPAASTSQPTSEPTPSPQPEAESSGDPVVYMTTALTAQGLVNVYNALEAAPEGRIAVKLSTGEPGSNYLRPELIGALIASLDNPTIVECNTAMHYQVAEDHGYTALAAVDIMDEEGSMTLPVEGGSNLTENYVGSHFANYDY